MIASRGDLFRHRFQLDQNGGVAVEVGDGEDAFAGAGQYRFLFSQVRHSSATIGPAGGTIFRNV